MSPMLPTTRVLRIWLIAALLLGVAGASGWPVAHAQVTPMVQLAGTLQIVRL